LTYYKSEVGDELPYLFLEIYGNSSERVMVSRKKELW